MGDLRQLVREETFWGQTDLASLSDESSARSDGDGTDFAEYRAALLTRTIEAEVIPRLLLAHLDDAEPSLREGPTPTVDQVIEFAMIAARDDAAEIPAFIASRRAEGMSIETLFLRLLTPAARYLGDLWAADLRTFADVTIGLSRLQQLLRELSTEFEEEAERLGPSLRILLVPAPGDQHTFGVHMVEEFFRRAGWDVWGELSLSHDELMALVRREWFDVVGLSASCDVLPERLASTIQSLRLASRNSGVGILVGGRLFLDRPDVVALVGADATALDAAQAVLAAPRIVCTVPRC